MSSGRSISHSTGSDRVVYVEGASAYTRSPTSTETSESLSSESSSWSELNDDDGIGPSDSASASRPPRAPEVERHARRTSRHSHRERRPTSTRRKSSNRIPTIREDERSSHRSHSDHSDRHERPYRDERDREPHRQHRESRARLPSSGSSSVESDYHYMGGGPHYSDLHHHPHPHPHPHQAPWGHPPPSAQSNYPPTVVSGNPGYDAQLRMQARYDPAALMRMPRHDYTDPMNHAAGYTSPPMDAFGHPSHNPFSPMNSQASAAGPADYFAPPYENRPSPFEGRPSPFEHRPSPHPSQHSHRSMSRPMTRSRPQSFAGPSPYASETALSPFYPPAPHNALSGYAPSPAIDHHVLALHLLELQEAKKAATGTPEPVKPRSPAPAAAEKKEEPKEDQAVKLMNLIAEHEEKKRLAAEERAKVDALAAASDKAAKEASEAESSKIAKLLLQFEEDRLKREKESKDKAEAEKAAAEAKAAREAELAAAAKAAKEAAEKDAAEKMKAAEEAATKKLAEATAAAEALEKAKKALEEDLAKHAPEPDDLKKGVHFEDALGRKYDVPWRYAKTWKGMKGLIEQAFNHVDVIGPLVMEGRYDLMGPDGMIILPQVWDLVVQPEWVIKMELWPTPEPDPAPPGAYPSDYLPMPSRKHKVEKAPKASSSKPHRSSRAPQVVGVAPAVHHATAQVPIPPPHFPAGMHYADEPFVSIIDESKAPKPKPKEKKKPPARTGFGAWITGTTRPAKSSGKDLEKPGQQPVQVHVHPHSLSSSDRTSSSPSNHSSDIPIPPPVPVAPSNKQHDKQQHDKRGRSHSHDKRRSSIQIHRRDSGADGFYVIERQASKTLPSAAQGASVRKNSQNSQSAEACTIM